MSQRIEGELQRLKRRQPLLFSGDREADFSHLWNILKLIQQPLVGNLNLAPCTGLHGHPSILQPLSKKIGPLASFHQGNDLHRIVWKQTRHGPLPLLPPWQAEPREFINWLESYQERSSSHFVLETTFFVFYFFFQIHFKGEMEKDAQVHEQWLMDGKSNSQLVFWGINLWIGFLASSPPFFFLIL